MRKKLIITAALFALIGFLVIVGTVVFKNVAKLQHLKLQTTAMPLSQKLSLDKNINLVLLDSIAQDDLTNIKIALSKGADVNYLTDTDWLFVNNERRGVVMDGNGKPHPLPVKYTSMSEEEWSQEVNRLMEDRNKNEEELKLIVTGETGPDLMGKTIVLLDKKSNPLILASKLGYAEIVAYLLKNGAVYSDEVLREALYANKIEVVAELLKEPRNLNTNFTNNSSPLMVAVEENNIDMAKLLMEKGALVGYNSSAVFNLAMRLNNANMIKLFLTQQPISSIWKEDQAIISWVVYNNPLEDKYVTDVMKINTDNRIEVLQVLLEKGADINETSSKYRDSALVQAIGDNRVENLVNIIFFLIDHGANVNEITSRLSNGTLGWGSSRLTVLDFTRALKKSMPEKKDVYEKIENKLREKGARSGY